MDIRTEGVQAVLGGSAILKGVDIQVGQRELVGIIGPNGSGKSTLLKCIYRVLKPTGGAVLLDGRDLDQYSYRESARRIAVVAQHNYYNFEFSVQDVVMMGRAPHKRALDRDNADDFRLVAEALELVGMSGFARRSFSTLSGGEQQRELRLDPVPVRRQEERLLLPQEAFLRFYTDGKGVSAQTDTETFAVPLRLYELEERLDKSRFARISNGEIINLNKVTAVDLSLSGTIRMTLEGGVYVYVSRRYVKKIKETLKAGRRRNQ